MGRRAGEMKIGTGYFAMGGAGRMDKAVTVADCNLRPEMVAERITGDLRDGRATRS